MAEKNVIDKNIEGRAPEKESIRKEVRNSGKGACNVGDSNPNMA